MINTNSDECESPGKRQLHQAIVDFFAETRHNGDGSTASSTESDVARVLRFASDLAKVDCPSPAACYLGPELSYSHLAALRYFGDAAELLPVASIAAVFDAVVAGDTPAGIVPIENSTDGRVVDTLSRLIDGGVRVIGEIRLPIHHCLMSIGTRDSITQIQSKPQALSQCRGYLTRHFPDIPRHPVTSTAAAARSAASDPSVAAIAGRQAAEGTSLKLLATDIEDNPDNVTRFIVLGRDIPPPSGRDKTSLLFQVGHHPGSLADAMNLFKNHGLNLSFIESFPSPGQPNQYQFFVEISGHPDDEPVRACLADLGDLAQRLLILGSYPET